VASHPRWTRWPRDDRYLETERAAGALKKKLDPKTGAVLEEKPEFIKRGEMAT
jgi:hypothetical protein